MAVCGGPPRLQRRAVALQESKLLSWEQRGTSLLLRFDGYVHASLGTPGQDQGTAWSQELEMVVREAGISDRPRELPLWITSGAVEVAGAPLLLVPVPFEETARVLLRLEGAEEKITVSGSGLTLTEVSEARFVERVARSPR